MPLLRAKQSLYLLHNLRQSAKRHFPNPEKIINRNRNRNIKHDIRKSNGQIPISLRRLNARKRQVLLCVPEGAVRAI